MTKSVDFLTKLLAQENLSIALVKAPTASFNIKTRVLSIPAWKDMTPEVDVLMRSHEVGHALWTTEHYIEFLRDGDNSKMKDVLNVVEDARIERMVKKAYPGVRKTFVEGYKQLQDKKFFGVSRDEYQSLSFVDRINIHFKIGISAGIKFNPEERKLVNRIESSETIFDVIEITKEVYALAKEEKNNINNSHEFSEEYSEDDSFEDDAEDQDYSSLDEEDTESGEEEETEDGESESNQTAADDTEEQEDAGEIISKTQRAFDKKLSESALDDSEYEYWDIENMSYDPIVDYKTVINTVKEHQNSIIKRYGNYYHDADKSSTDFKSKNLPIVNYLSKEFEMKKAAEIFNRSLQAKTGSIDTKKLYAYKTKDDLFRRTTVVPKGKNHGMVMLVDWSGSMHSNIEDTLKQVANLVMFCRKSQIPFQVFAFYDGMRQTPSGVNVPYEGLQVNKDTHKVSPSGFVLLELFSDKMNSSEFNTMIGNVTTPRFITSAYSMNGTPLNESLLHMGSYIKKFKQSRNIEKVTFITLSDGLGSGFNFSGSRYGYRYGNVKNFLRSASGKTYEVSMDVAATMASLYSYIKDESNATTINFYLSGTSPRDIRGFFNTFNIASDVSWEFIDVIRKKLRGDKFAAFSDAVNLDKLFFLPTTNNRIFTQELDIDSSKSSKSIASKFSKHMSNERTSRVLLTEFIELIA